MRISLNLLFLSKYLHHCYCCCISAPGWRPEYFRDFFRRKPFKHDHAAEKEDRSASAVSGTGVVLWCYPLDSGWTSNSNSWLHGLKKLQETLQDVALAPSAQIIACLKKKKKEPMPLWTTLNSQLCFCPEQTQGCPSHSGAIGNVRLNKSSSPSALEQSTHCKGAGLIWGSWHHAEPAAHPPPSSPISTTPWEETVMWSTGSCKTPPGSILFPPDGLCADKHRS